VAKAISFAKRMVPTEKRHRPVKATENSMEQCSGVANHQSEIKGNLVAERI
jgi:hypothetical protein